VTETFEMETQPQLLLLQKTMLVAEGVGRRLAPQANMWVLAQPMIERWKTEYFGPEARLVAAAEEVVQGLQRLPRLVSNIERSAEIIARGGVRIDPEAYARAAELRGLTRQPRRTIPINVYFMIAAILLVVLYFI
jgi:ubiquinone biosynthesis protein